MLKNVKHTTKDDIKTKHLVWYGHVQQMPDERIPKQMITWMPPGKREEEVWEKVGEGGKDKELRQTYWRTYGLIRGKIAVRNQRQKTA